MGIIIMVDQMKKLAKTLRRAVRSRKGLSIAETMAALIIVSLLTMCLATGTAFGVRQYRHAMTRSEARILCSTLSAIVSDELSNTQEVTGTEAADGFTVATYNSRRYKAFVQLKADGDGCLCAGSNELLSKAAYSKGFQDLLVEDPEITFDQTANCFTVKLSIVDADKNPLVSTTFDVVPLNPVTPNPGESGGE